MTMRAVVYARVSSSAQRERDTIASQLRALPAYVEAQGWTLVGTYADDGHSAKTGKLGKRDGFARLLKDAEAKLFDIVVVADVDRLTRTDSLEERAKILGPFQRLGIDIVTPGGGRQDLRTMLGELYVTMQAMVAAEENRKRASRITEGKITALKRGKKPSGPTPYGHAYDRATGAWSVDPVRGPIVVEMFERVAAGESCLTIAEDFAARGIPRPRGEWIGHRVWCVVRSRHPVGEWTGDKRRKIVVAVPPIVSEDLWQRAQRALLRHRKRGLRRTKHTYMLEGIAVCGECGAPMLIQSEHAARNGRRNPSLYVCRNRKNVKLSHAASGKHRCTAELVKTADADERAWVAVCEYLHRPDLAGELAAERATVSADARDWAADAAGYEVHIARLDKVEATVFALHRKGTVTMEALERELAAINRERSAVRSQLATARRALHRAQDTDERLRDATAMLTKLRAKLAKTSPEQRRGIIMALAEPGQIVFHGQEITLTLLVPRGRAVAASRGEAVLALVDASVCTSQHESYLQIRVVA